MAHAEENSNEPTRPDRSVADASGGSVLRTPRLNRTDWLIFLVQMCAGILIAMGQRHVVLGVLGWLALGISSVIFVLRSKA
jgi:hypothetical protein